MAEIYLQHPRHGQKAACTEAEAKHDRENGWTDFEPTPTPKPQEATATLPDFLGGGVVSDLQPDFPGRAPLIEAGLNTWASLQGKTKADLVALPGIGDKTADAIIKALDV